MICCKNYKDRYENRVYVENESRELCMSKLEELLQELCPNGVKYMKVGDVCSTITDYTAAGSFADIAKNVKYVNNESGLPN